MPLFIASAGAATAPATVLASQAGEALRGAKVEFVNVRAEEGAAVTTDADGRFLFTTVATSRIDYRIVHGTETTPVRLMRFGGEHAARLDRDHEGTWRTTFTLALA